MRPMYLFSILILLHCNNGWDMRQPEEKRVPKSEEIQEFDKIGSIDPLAEDPERESNPK